MKKLFILPIFALGLAFFSCKKDRKCSCVTSGGTSTNTPDVISFTGVTKKTAKANCVSSSWTDAGGTNYTKTCTLS